MDLLTYFPSQFKDVQGKRVTKIFERYGITDSANNARHRFPVSVAEAMQSAESDGQKAAINVEIQSITNKGSWTGVKLPRYAALDSMNVFSTDLGITEPWTGTKSACL